MARSRQILFVVVRLSLLSLTWHSFRKQIPNDILYWYDQENYRETFQANPKYYGPFVTKRYRCIRRYQIQLFEIVLVGE
ncbi:hypothetical protein V1508DRAFT_425780 [Lipomyces doorenjongii]|uniref:uncharacterized protein n=1 Tax=Lipomyces doorenjongii TaxID=383834 RepID=UPI0034CD60DF